ncbi:hypothetical protein DSECCO2_592860 [anaerobic digester metagenome]
MAVPIVWNWAAAVDIAAESRLSMKSVTNISGMAWFRKVGIIRSVFPSGTT